jgi:hypothetical protein
MTCHLRDLDHLRDFMTCLLCQNMNREEVGKLFVYTAIGQKLIELKGRDYRGLFCF